MTTSARRDEAQRINALRSLEILDAPPEETFDRFARLAAGLLDAPVARVSLIDADREVFLAALGCERTSIPRAISFCTWTVARNAPLVVSDLTQDPRFAANPRVAGPPHYRFYAGVPLRDRDGNSLGALCCLDYEPRQLRPAQTELLQDLAQLAVEAMDLRRVATTDSLTGAMTRRAFTEALRRDVAQALRSGRALSCVMLDVDHFKTVNDTLGHAAGDEVLRRLSWLCRESMRGSDYMGRLGGEEFAIVLRDTKASQAVELAERLRLRIAAAGFPASGQQLRITASLGLGGLRLGMTATTLLNEADKALYAAKRAGRDRTMSAEMVGVGAIKVAS